MWHTKKDGTVNWKDTDGIVVQLAGTFAADRFIVIKNRTKDPVVSAAPHPDFDYESIRDWALPLWIVKSITRQIPCQSVPYDKSNLINGIFKKVLCVGSLNQNGLHTLQN